jgi:Uma2 family endonuclease
MQATPLVKKRVTLEEFERFIYLPENVDREFEYIGGEIVEVVSNSYSSEIAANILAEIKFHAKKHKAGRVTGADGGYIIAGERYIPDVAFISFEKQPQPSRAAYNPTPPDLAVEVLSPTDDDRQMRIKVTNYLSEGTVVWVVNPDERSLEIHQTGKSVTVLDETQTLEGGDVLPGFRLPLAEIFPEEV